jgi:chromosome segregation ATPase
MNTQGTARIELPEKVQEAINIASQKVAVLREEEVRLARLKGETEKDIARLEITRDTLEGELPKLEASVVSAQNTLESLEKEIRAAKERLGLVESERKSEEKALKALGEEAVKKSEALSRTVEKTHEVESDIEAKKAALKSELEAFAVRKERMREFLATL